MHKRVWLLLAVIAMILGHGILFYFMYSRLTLSAAMIASVIVLLAIKLILIKR